MKAAQFYSKEDVRIEEVPDPQVAPGYVKLKNAYSGICGSDLHVYYNPDSSGVDFTKPHPITGALLPQILGHEFSGTVVDIGDNVTGIEVGDRAVVWPIYYCGDCSACDRGAYNICRNIAFHGLSSVGGGMAGYTCVPASMLHKLPPAVDLRLGALVEPMAVGWHAVERSGIRPGQSALVVGAGPIGIGIWFALRAHGIEQIIVSEPSAARRDAIASLGADHLVDPAAERLADRVGALTSGRGVDVAFDAAGISIGLQQSLANLVPAGNLVIVALHEHPAQLDATGVVQSETTITGSMAYLPSDFDSVIEAMEDGKYSTDGWVTEIALDELVEGFAELRAGNRMKVLVKL
ncbi:alcohol dehydrogenase catalytic domain-containing protein [Nocardia sp. R7R-8]|uniref:alcohol dehydrogenase catalytic domain-containing protein n=1 Tax=Nocardia sp. R7R-8 TaxID=3459304 RepID=UPI00403E2063